MLIVNFVFLRNQSADWRKGSMYSALILRALRLLCVLCGKK
jgi:hypothetical protein